MKTKKPLIFLSILGLFLAFLLIFLPNGHEVRAATVSPPTTSTLTTAPPGTTTTTNAITASSTTTPVAQPKKEIPILGLGSNDAAVTDMNGQPVKPTDDLFTWLNFNVNYNWSIADGIQINDGDTSSFQLPAGLVASGDLTFPIYDDAGVQIGTGTIKNGEKFGTITFNNVLSTTTTDRKGTLSLVSKGTSTSNGNEGENWMFNKVGWVAGYDQNGTPNELTWNVAFNPNQHNLTNVVITDILGPNQEYIPGSINAIGGSYVDGKFVGVNQLNPTVTTEGNKVIISFPGTVTTAVDIYYRVKVTDVTPGATNTWRNHANMGSSEGNYEVDASTSWGGSGTGGGTVQTGGFQLTKFDSVSNKPLAGATYELTDSTGKVVMSNLETNSNGQIAIKGLALGSYTLKEITAPTGYQVNSTPINFTIPTDGNLTIGLGQADVADTGNVTLTKTDAQDKLLPGAIYNLLDSNGNILQGNLVTDKNGVIGITGLEPGSYSFVEIKAPEGYDINPDPIKFEITSSNTTNLQAKDQTTPEPSVGNVVLTKVDAKVNKLLPGAIYDLQDSNGVVIQSGLETDSNGQISISGLPVGSFALVETKAPEGYDINPDPIKFEITKDNTTELQAEDIESPEGPGTITPPTITPEEPDVGNVTLNKVDTNDNTPLAGAVYDLLDNNGKVIQSGLTTDANGQINIAGLPVGSYSLVETKAPENYLINKDPIKFEITKNGTTVLEAKNTEILATPPEGENPGTTVPPTTPPTVKPPVKPVPPITPPTVKPPVKPVPPVTPPTVKPPVKPVPPVTPPTVKPPVKPEPPVEPEKPGVTNPPTEPIKPEPPVKPEEPGQVIPPAEPENPNVVTPPVSPNEVLPPIGSGNVGGGSSSGISTTPGSSSSDKGKFPQTGNESGLLLTVIGFIAVLFLFLKHLIKKSKI